MIPNSRLDVSGVYLIHAERPLFHAQHYIGYADNIQSRIRQHKRGHGAKLLRAFKQNGIRWQVVRIWEGADRNFERLLHKRKYSPRICPVCHPPKQDRY